MNPLTLQSGGPRGAPRRKVRIVKQRRFSRLALLSFLLGSLAAVAFPLLWYIHRPSPKPDALHQDARNWVWKCDDGHTFRAPFRSATLPCLTCGKPAYPVGWYTCPVHGSFEVAAKFERGEDGKLAASMVRLIGRRWVKEEDLKCPRCDRHLVYKGRDPLERALRAKKQGGE